MRELRETLYQWNDDFVVEDSAFVEHFGWEATPLHRGIQSALDWYRTRHGATDPAAVARRGFLICGRLTCRRAGGK